jgi:SIR2-like domain
MEKKQNAFDHCQDWREFDFSRLQSNPLYFYVGSGLSAAAGLVGWEEMACIVWWYRKRYEKGSPGRCPSNGSESARFLQRFVTQPMSKGSRVRILSRPSTDPRALGRTVLLNLILRRRAPRTKLTHKDGKATQDPKQPQRSRCGEEPSGEDFALHSLVWRAGCHGVLTPNYDMFLEHAYSLFHGPGLRSYRPTADFLRYIMTNPKFVLKLHGDINDIGTMQLNPRQLWSGRRPGQFRRDDLKQVYATALQRGHMVYVGVGFRDDTIVQLHKYWRDNNDNKKPSPRRLRVALLPRWEIKDIKEDLRQLGASKDLFDDVLFLTYGSEARKGAQARMPTNHIRDHVYDPVREFLSHIVAVRMHDRRDWHATDEARDIFHQVFLSQAGHVPKQNFKTEPWTCAGLPVRR